MKNEDQECFKWSVTRALNPVVDNPKRVTKILKEQVEILNWEGVNFKKCVKIVKVLGVEI